MTLNEIPINGEISHASGQKEYYKNINTNSIHYQLNSQ